MLNSARYVVGLDEIEYDDIHIVGEHAAHIANARKSNILTLPGFVITPAAYFAFLEHESLKNKLAHLLGSASFENDKSVELVSGYIKNIINHSRIPNEIVNDVFNAYARLPEGSVSVHTSIISGDSEQIKFPREYKFEAILGEAALIDVLRNFWGSIYDPQLLKYRNDKGIDHLNTGISASIKKNVRGTSSGKILTFDPILNDKSKFIIIFDGSGYIYSVDKESKNIEKKRDHGQSMVFIKDGNHNVHSISDEEILKIVEITKDLENNFLQPLEISWAQENGLYYINNIKQINLYGSN